MLQSDGGTHHAAKKKATARGPQGLPIQASSPARKRKTYPALAKVAHPNKIAQPNQLPTVTEHPRSVRGSARASYKLKPVAQRKADLTSARARKSSGKATAADHAILRLHASRQKRAAARQATELKVAKQAGQIARLGATFIGNTLNMHAGEKPTIDQDAESKAYAAAMKKAGFATATISKHPWKQAGFVDHAMIAPIAALTSGPAAVQGTIQSHGKHLPSDLAKTVAAPFLGVAGLGDLVIHPKSAPHKLGEMAKSFVKEADKPYADKVKEVKKHGAFDQAATFATVALPGAAGIVKHLRKGVSADLRVAGGKVKAAENRRVGSAYTDRLKARKLAVELHHAEQGGAKMDPLRWAAATANRDAGFKVNGRKTSGPVVEVTKHNWGGAHSPGSMDRTLRLGTAKTRGRVFNELHTHGAKTAKQIAKERTEGGRLSLAEQAALHFAQTGGLRTAQHAKDLLPSARARMLVKRGGPAVGGMKRADLVHAIDLIMKDPEAAFSPRVRAAADDLGPIGHRAGEEDPRYPTSQLAARRIKPMAYMLGLERGKDESFAEFAGRVYTDAAKHGLADPTYKPSERYARASDAVSFTLGFGRNKADKRYSGANLEHGYEDWRPEVFDRGVQRNIRAKHVQELIDRTIADHAIVHDDFNGQTSREVIDALTKAGLDENRYALVNLSEMQKYMEKSREADSPSMDHENPELYQAENTRLALERSTHQVGTPLLDDSVGRWAVLPKAVYREMLDASRPQNGGMRAWGVFKGKQSRAMLLGGNVPWLGTQVLANVAQATAATRGGLLNPLNHVAAREWWSRMNEEERRKQGAMFGIDGAGAVHRQNHMGVTSTGGISTAWRNFKAHPFWHTPIQAGPAKGPRVDQLNPMEWMAAGDRHQNNYFRIVTAYTALKHESAREFAGSWTNLDGAINRAMTLFHMPAHDQIDALTRNPAVLERVGERIEDLLGDYTTMTALERRTVGQIPMFYPYLRFSLRLLTTIMPLKHPVATAVGIQLGQLHDDELRKLGIVREGMSPLSRLRADSTVYNSDGSSAVDLSRINPLMNSVTQVAATESPSGVYGVFPPVITWLVDQADHRSHFEDREWRVQGHASGYGLKGSDYGWHVRARILLNDLMSVTYPTRELLKHDTRPQGDDSLPGSRRPTVYKGKRKVDILGRQEAATQQKFTEEHSGLLQRMLPVMPHASRDVEAAQAQATIRKERAKYGHKNKKPGPTRRKSYGLSSGGGGGSSSGPNYSLGG